MQPFPDEQLADLAEGRLQTEAAHALRAQIATDPAALETLSAFETIMGLMRDDDSIDAPEHVIARALRLMRQPAPLSAPGLLQRIVAVLRSDSRQLPLTSGLRSGDDLPRSLIYHADTFDIDLQIAPRAGRWQLQGQILGDQLHGTVLLSSAQQSLSAPINELGEFSLPPVDAGSYMLLIQLESHELLIEELELGY
jgi:anti-sigma factor RsiW